MFDDSEYQRTGADRGGAAGDDTCGSGTESGNNRADSRDFLSYLLKKYGTVQDALAAYNYGEKGAREHLWSNGVYVYSYNSAIMQRMKEIEEVVGK